MKRVISAMFDDYQAAADAVAKLETAGVPHSDISIVGGNDEMRTRSGEAGTGEPGSATGTGASTGAVIGGAGGLLAGLGMMAIPGLGPVVAAGWLASTLVGAAAGAAAGGIIGALTSWGMSEEEAETYAEGIRRGGTLVTARVDDALFDRTVDILDVDGAVDMDQRADAWRTEGWSNPATGTSPAGAVPGMPPQPAEMRPAGTSEGTSVPTTSSTARTRQPHPRVRVHAHPMTEAMSESAEHPPRRTDVEVEDTRRMQQDRDLERGRG